MAHLSAQLVLVAASGVESGLGQVVSAARMQSGRVRRGAGTRTGPLLACVFLCRVPIPSSRSSSRRSKRKNGRKEEAKSPRSKVCAFN